MHATFPPLFFDMELFLRTTGEIYLADEEARECRAFWREWHASLFIKNVTTMADYFLAVWLDASVEQTIDATWRDSPSRGFRLHSLAQMLCMSAVRERIPEIGYAGCAPVPASDPALIQVLADAGLPSHARNGLVLDRRYAVVTPTIFRGRCALCALRETCPCLQIIL